MPASLDDVLLVTPPIANFSETPAPSLGILFLASALRQHGLGVTVLDLPTVADADSVFEDAIETVRPVVVGIGCMQQDLAAALNLVRRAKELKPRCSVALGGPGVSALAVTILEECADADAVVRGEGERSFVEYVLARRSGRPPSDIPGVVWRSDEGIRDNGAGSLALDLDELAPPAWDLVDFRYYSSLSSSIPVISTRGCPAACPFCPSPAFWNYRTRKHRTEGFLNQIEGLVNSYPGGGVYVADDDVAHDHLHLTSWLSGLREHQLKLDWQCNARLDSLTPRLLEVMRETGCRRVTVGLESASPILRRRIGKGAFSNSEAMLNLRAAKNLGLGLKINLMFGLPGETQRDVEESLMLIGEIEPDVVTYSAFALYPGTKLEKATRRRGRHGEKQAYKEPLGLTVLADEDRMERDITRVEAELGLSVPRAGSW